MEKLPYPLHHGNSHVCCQASPLTLPILALKDHDSYIKAADLYRICRTNGLTIRSTIDLLIAQTAIEYDAELLHNDRDFEAIASMSSLRLYRIAV